MNINLNKTNVSTALYETCDRLESEISKGSYIHMRDWKISQNKLIIFELTRTTLD